MKKIWLGLAGLLAGAFLSVLLFLSYALPGVDVVRAVGTEIKRVDVTAPQSDQPRTRDVYWLQTESLDGQARVYRNEDNFFYLKYNSADVQTQVESFSADKQVIAIRHYGWRISLFSMFPNAVSVWQVEPDYQHIPVFNTLVLAVVFGGFGWLFWRWRVAYVHVREKERVQQERQMRQAEERVAAAQEKEQSKRAEIDAFLND